SGLSRMGIKIYKGEARRMPSYSRVVYHQKWARTHILCKWAHILCKQLTNILAGPHWLQRVSSDRFSLVPSGSRPPRGAHRAAARRPAVADVTLPCVREAVEHGETPALPADEYPITRTTL